MMILNNFEKKQLKSYIKLKCKDLRFIYDFKKMTGTFAEIKIKIIKDDSILLSVSYGYSNSYKEIYNGQIELDRKTFEEKKVEFFELLEKEPGEEEIITKFDLI